MSTRERVTFINLAEPPLMVPLFLQEKFLYQATLDFVQGRIIDWHSPKAPQITSTQLSDIKSRTCRTLMGLVIREGPEALKALDIMRQDLERLDPDIEMLKSPVAQEFLLKLSLGMLIHSSISARVHALGPHVTTKEKRQFQDLVEKRVFKFISLYRKFDPQDLGTFISLEDIIFRAPEYQGTKTKRVPKGATVAIFEPLPLNISLQELGNAVVENELSFTQEIWQARNDAWERLKDGWGWHEIQTVARLLPQIQNPEVLAITLSALETNLLAFNPRINREVLNFDTREVVFLLDKKWSANENNIKLFDSPQRTITINGNSVPREYTPSIAISLLTAIAETPNRENFYKLLGDVSQQVALMKDPNILDAWTVTLLSIAQIDAQSLTELLDQSRIPSRLKETLTDQRPGKVRLLKNGKLQVREASSQINEGFLIYTSGATQPPQEAQEFAPLPIVREKTITEDPRQKAAKEIITNPYLGRLALITDSDASQTLEENALKNGAIIDSDELLLTLIELQEKFDPTTERTLIYVSRLNPHDALLRDAKHFGVQMAVVDGRTITFVFDTDIAYTQVGRERIPAAFQTTLDKNGDSEQQGINDSLQMLLNTLAVSLITRDFANPKEADQSLNGDLEKVVKSWNENPRIFRIGSESKDGQIPIEVKGQTILHSILN